MIALSEPLRPLTERELQVARLVAQGKSYGAIGLELECSPRTVQSHVMRIAAKIPGQAAPFRRVMIWSLRNLDQLS